MIHPPEGIWALQRGWDTDLLIPEEDTLIVCPLGFLHSREPVIAVLAGRSVKPTAEPHSTSTLH